jgi:hypothetical protein
MRSLVIAFFALAIVTACATSQVTGGKSIAPSPPATKLLVLVNGGGAMRTPSLTNEGRQAVARLLPMLSHEISREFNRRNLPSRVDDVYVSDQALFGSLRAGPGERILVLLSRIEGPNSRLVFWVQLLGDAPLHAPAWTAQIPMGSVQDPKLDREALRAVAAQLLAAMQRDNVVPAH